MQHFVKSKCSTISPWACELRRAARLLREHCPRDHYPDRVMVELVDRWALVGLVSVMFFLSRDLLSTVLIAALTHLACGSAQIFTPRLVTKLGSKEKIMLAVLSNERRSGQKSAEESIFQTPKQPMSTFLLSSVSGKGGKSPGDSQLLAAVIHGSNQTLELKWTPRTNYFSWSVPPSFSSLELTTSLGELEIMSMSF